MDVLAYFGIVFYSALIFNFVDCKPSPSRTTRREKNFSFAIPALQLLGGGGGGGIGNVNPNAVNDGNLPNINSNNQFFSQSQSANNFGNNLFRQVTVTRTIMTTVGTVTVPVFRTCTTSQGVLPACMGAGRRKRSAENLSDTSHALEMLLIMGSATVSDQLLVSKMLNLGQSGSSQNGANDKSAGFVPETVPTFPVALYPSEDSHRMQDFYQATIAESSETPALLYNDDSMTDYARINLAGTTTITRTVPVTAIVNSTVTGVGGNTASLTLTIAYGGCAPPTFPVTGTPC